jgi:hypothetical protein
MTASDGKFKDDIDAASTENKNPSKSTTAIYLRQLCTHIAPPDVEAS